MGLNKCNSQYFVCFLCSEYFMLYQIEENRRHKTWLLLLLQDNLTFSMKKKIGAYREDISV